MNGAVEAIHRGKVARLGILLLSLLLPGLGLQRLGRFKWAFGFMAAQFLVGWLFWLRCAYGPLLTFWSWLTWVALGVVALLATYITALVLTWRASRLLIPRDGWLWRWYSVALVWIVMALLASPIGSFETYYRNFYIPSESMQPGLLIGDRLVASMRPVTSIQRGDVVILRHGKDFWIRRVAALPGDRFAMTDGRVVLNGQPVPVKALGNTMASYGKDKRSALLLDEQFPGEVHPHQIVDMERTPQDNVPSTTLGADQYILLGDNRDNSMDSRFTAEDEGLGIVRRDEILGRALFRYWRRGEGFGGGAI